MTLVCESEFYDEDPNHPGYSMGECDFYSHIPYTAITSSEPNHRLTLRKNLKTQEYELFKVFQRSNVVATGSLLMMVDQDTPGEKVVAKSKSLGEILAEVERLETLYWGKEDWNEKVCTHDPKHHASFCRLWAGKLIQP